MRLGGRVCRHMIREPGDQRHLRLGWSLEKIREVVGWMLSKLSSQYVGSCTGWLEKARRVSWMKSMRSEGVPVRRVL